VGKEKEHGPTAAYLKDSLLLAIRTATANAEAQQVSPECVDMLTASLWVGNENASANVMCQPRL